MISWGWYCHKFYNIYTSYPNDNTNQKLAIVPYFLFEISLIWPCSFQEVKNVKFLRDKYNGQRLIVIGHLNDSSDLKKSRLRNVS